MMEFSRRRSTSIEEINEDIGGGALAAGTTEEEESPPTHVVAAMAAATVVEREHMFDKVVTPSDVGKLNRLVIPKQHAERYFPLDASSNDKGLLLSFEDSNGKPWRFRYSYWNSSQSYVMTKGWSRFVKEKRLDAGDTVSFGRGLGDAGRDRLFIDWKRRPESHYQLPRGLPRITLPLSLHMASSHSSILSFASSAAVPQPPWGGSRLFVPCPNTTAFDQSYSAYNANAQYLYFRTGAAAAAAVPDAAALQFSGGGAVGGTNATARVAPMVLDSVPEAHNKAVGRSVRIFGVNLDCPKSDSSNDDDDDAPPLRLQLGWAGESSDHTHHR